MKVVCYPTIVFLLSLISFNTHAAGSLLRITCEGNDIGAEVFIDGKFRGECPVDLKVSAGRLNLRIVKSIDAAYERILEQNIRMGEGSIKKVEAILSAPQLNAAAQKVENKRLAIEQANIQKREAEAQRARIKLEQQYEAYEVEASKAGPQAMFALATRYAKGDGLPKNHDKALNLYGKAALAGHTPAMNALGKWYAKDAIYYDKAVTWFRKSAESGDAEGMAKLGAMYYVGYGLTQDYDQARIWFNKSAESNNADGIKGMANLYFYGHGGFSKDIEQGMMLFEKSATAGNINAMTQLVKIYRKGENENAPDYERALYWARKAAENGSARGMVMLADFYRKGQGVVKNSEQANMWYIKGATAHQKKADAGYRSSMYILGRLHASGRGFNKSEQDAIRWYRAAAEKGHTGAIKELKKRGLM